MINLKKLRKSKGLTLDDILKRRIEMSEYTVKKITPIGLDRAIELLDDDIKDFKVEISEYVIDHIYLDSEVRNLLKSLYWQLNGLENDVQGIKDILAEQAEASE